MEVHIMEEQSGFFGDFVNEESNDHTAQALMESSELLQQLLLENEHYAQKEKHEPTEGVASLDRTVERYRSIKKARLEQYIELLSSYEPTIKHPLHFFEEWPTNCAHSLYPISEEKSFGGFYFSWNGCGVVVNPSMAFLEAFHQRGHHIRQIHHIFLTNDREESYRPILEIYRLNSLVNQSTNQHHIISYHLNAASHRKLSTRLKPHVKQERNAVRSLEFFEDSEQIEQFTLADELSVSYFPTNGGSLGLQFSLSGTRVTYLTDSTFEETIINQLPATQILILGLQKTDPEDLLKVAYTPDALGYFGAYSLIQSLKPRITFITEFPEDSGDVRLEICRQLRQESTNTPAIFPVDATLSFDLDTLSIRSSDTKRWVEHGSIAVLKGAKPFSPLQYISKDSLL